jgi:hypothetical protein
LGPTRAAPPSPRGRCSGQPRSNKMTRIALTGGSKTVELVGYLQHRIMLDHILNHAPNWLVGICCTKAASLAFSAAVIFDSSIRSHSPYISKEEADTILNRRSSQWVFFASSNALSTKPSNSSFWPFELEACLSAALFLFFDSTGSPLPSL